jgi:hypothetical protein
MNLCALKGMNDILPEEIGRLWYTLGPISRSGRLMPR